MHSSSNLSTLHVVWVPNSIKGKNNPPDQDPLQAFADPDSVPASVAPMMNSGINYSLAEIRRMGRKQPKPQGNPTENNVIPVSSSDLAETGNVSFEFGYLNSSISEPDLKENESDGLPFCITKVWSISAEAENRTIQADPDHSSGNLQLVIPHVVNVSLPANANTYANSPKRLLETQRIQMSMQTQVDKVLLKNLSSTVDAVEALKDPLEINIGEKNTASSDANTSDLGKWYTVSESEMDSDCIIIRDFKETEAPPSKKLKEEENGFVVKQDETEKVFPKPPYSYACLIAMALKNSQAGCLPVSEIYRFLFDHFPYFKSAPSGWKDQIRSYLKTKYFEKSNTADDGVRKGNSWATNPAMVPKFDKEMQKWSSRNYSRVVSSLSDPENLELLENGKLIRDYRGPVALGAAKKVEQTGAAATTTGRPRGRPKGSKGRKSIQTIKHAAHNE